MSPKAKNLVAQLSRRGPHPVLRGDLAVAGLRGSVHTPKIGLGLPAVAFAHGWMSRADNYKHLLEHLASWGIVVVAPNTERGPIPSHREFVADLLTALDLGTSARLGDGQISVDRARLGLVGDGMGASVATLAAAQRHDVKAVAALFPAQTEPSAQQAAPSVTASGLVLAGATDVDAPQSIARELAVAWGGPVAARTLAKASAAGLAQRSWKVAKLGVGSSEPKTRKLADALVTGFLLYTLTGDSTYQAFAEDGSIPGTTALPTDSLELPPPGKLAKLRELVGR